MNANISNWLSNVKSDDIDGGLAADFDGSLSGLGVELGASTYNMSEALLALPSVYKQENNRSANTFLLQHEEQNTPLLNVYSISNGTTSDSPIITSRSLTLPLLRTVSFPSVELITSSPHSASLPSLSDTQNMTGDMDGSLVDNMTTEWVSLMTSMKLGEVEDCSCKPRFQYILNASTSPATKMSEETLTYLNQGQPYEITLKHPKDGTHGELPLLKSIIRVVFHEKKLQSMEHQQLEIWMSMRPGERIMDIDLPPSHGIMDVKVDPQKLNSVEFVWDPNSMETTSVFVKVNCVSSEFTAKKHGGEKGVPFRIRVETYSNNLDEDNMLLHYASCQIKVFKPKGADRKNKTDKEKIEKQGESEKGKFQPAFNCTVLTETKEQSLTNHIIPSGVLPCLVHSSQPPSTSNISLTMASLVDNNTSARTSNVIHPSSFDDGQLTNSDDTLSMKQSKNLTSSIPPTCSTTSVSGTVSRKRPLESCSYVCSSHSPPAFDEDTLLPASTPDEVSLWLISNRFHDFMDTFSNFSGSDLLRLGRDDLIQICGIANGIRLHNTLLAKSVQPRLTLYVCQITNWPNNDQIHPSSEPQHSPESSKSRSSTSSPIPASPNPHAASSQHRHPQLSNLSLDDSVQSFLNGGDASNFNDLNFNSSCKDNFKLSEEQASKPQLTFSGFNFSTSASVNSKSGNSKTRCKMSHFSPENRKKFDFKFSAGDQVMKSTPESIERNKELNEEVQIQCSNLASFSSTNLPSIYSNKRSMSDKDEDSSNQSLLVFKKQRIQNPEVVPREVFHAVYLENLTERHLALKLACFFSLPQEVISQVLLKNCLGFFVLIDDKVVQNMRDSSSFIIDVIEDEEFIGLYKLILKPVEAS